MSKRSLSPRPFKINMKPSSGQDSIKGFVQGGVKRVNNTNSVKAYNKKRKSL